MSVTFGSTVNGTASGDFAVTIKFSSDTVISISDLVVTGATVSSLSGGGDSYVSMIHLTSNSGTVNLSITGFAGSISIPFSVYVNPLLPSSTPPSIAPVVSVSPVYHVPGSRAFNWQAFVFINGIEVTDYTISSIDIEREEGVSCVADIVLKPIAGSTFSIAGTVRKSVQIKVSEVDTNGTPGPSVCVFNGVIDSPDLNLNEQTLTLHCTDDMQGIVMSKTKQELMTLVNGRYSNHVFDESNVWQYTQDILSTVQSSLDLDINRSIRVTPWKSKTVADLSYYDDHVRDGSLNVSLADASGIVNRVDIDFGYRFERAKKETYSCHLQGADMKRYVKNGGHLLTRDQVYSALESSGGHIEYINYHDAPPGGGYTTTGDYTGLNATGTGTAFIFNYGDQNYDKRIADEMSRAAQFDEDNENPPGTTKPIISASNLSFFTNNRLNFCSGFDAAVSFDYGQFIDEKFKIVVKNDMSIANIGETKNELSGSVEAKSDEEALDKTYTIPNLSEKALVSTGPSYSVGQQEFLAIKAKFDANNKNISSEEGASYYSARPNGNGFFSNNPSHVTEINDLFNTVGSTAYSIKPGVIAGFVTSVDKKVTDDTNRESSDNAIETLISIAKQKIASSHRQTSVEFSIAFDSRPDVDKTIYINSKGCESKGKCSYVKHYLNSESGEAITTVKIAVSTVSGVGVVHPDTEIAAPKGTSASVKKLQKPYGIVIWNDCETFSDIDFVIPGTDTPMFVPAENGDFSLVVIFPNIEEYEIQNSEHEINSIVDSSIDEDLFNITWVQ